MKTIVVYKSKSGFTRKYAEWINEHLDADLIEASGVTLNMLKKYDTIIYGGGLYILGINGLKTIMKHIDELKDKNIVVFASGASPARKEGLVKVRDANIAIDLQAKIPFFYMRGGFDQTLLKPIDSILMSMLKIKLRFKKNITPDERGMIEAYSVPMDFTKKDRIMPLVEYVQGLNTN